MQQGINLLDMIIGTQLADTSCSHFLTKCVKCEHNQVSKWYFVKYEINKL